MCNVWADSSLIREGLLGQHMLERLQYVQVDGNKLLSYIMQNRLKWVGVILVAATTILGLVCSYAFSFWFGCTTGIIIAVFTLRFGIKGCALFLVCAFPQMLFYVPAFYKLLIECHSISSMLYFPNKSFGYGSSGSRSRSVVRVATAIGLIAVGIFLESYMNPMLVSKAVTLLKIM